MTLARQFPGGNPGSIRLRPLKCVCRQTGSNAASPPVHTALFSTRCMRVHYSCSLALHYYLAPGGACYSFPSGQSSLASGLSERSICCSASWEAMETMLGRSDSG
jgi:hypothetical protein